MDSVKEGIRLNLIELLERTGKKRSDLAKVCGVGKSAVSNWVSGDSSIDVERIPAICEFFEITIDEFFGRSQELEPAPDLTSDEREFIHLLRKCDDYQKKTLLSTMREAAGDGHSFFISSKLRGSNGNYFTTEDLVALKEAF